MDNNADNRTENLKSIRKKLVAFLKYPQKEIPLKKIEKIILKELGCVREKSKGGSAVKYSHSVLENHPQFTAGIFSIHLIHGKSKNNPMIRKGNYKKIMWPVLDIILNDLEGEQSEA